MEKVNVVVTASVPGTHFVALGLGEESTTKVKAISPRVNLIDASELLQEEQAGDSSHRAELDNILAKAEILFGFRLPKDVIKRAPNVKWMQMMSAGIDLVMTDEIANSNVTMTNVSGIHAVPISEWVIGAMLIHAKRMPVYFDYKNQHLWKRHTSSALRNKTIGILGLGHIGREVARLAKAFGMHVMATRRSYKEGMKARNVDHLMANSNLNELLKESDYVVITLPFTPETKKLIGEKELRLMKETACLINIGRGGIIDQPVLLKALRENWIGGAALDVYTPEPLPADSPLWDLPNLIFSPHVSGSMVDYVFRATNVFCKNLERYLTGKRLINVVNKKSGY